MPISSPGPSDPDAAPAAAYLRSASVSYPLILVTQALLWQALWEEGLAAAVGGGAIVAAAGHSQGLLAALLVAEAGPRGVDDALLARYVRLAWAVGMHAAQRTQGGPQPPLAVVSGVRLARLEPLIEEVNASVAAPAAIAVALVNTPRRIVVGGPPATLGLLRSRLQAQARAEQLRAARGTPRRRAAELRLERRRGRRRLPHAGARAAARRAAATGCAASPRSCPTRPRSRSPCCRRATGADLRDCDDLADAVAAGSSSRPCAGTRSRARSPSAARAGSSTSGRAPTSRR